MPGARNAGGALCAGRSALQKGAVGGPTGVSNTMQARASEFLEHHDHRPCPCHKNATTNTKCTKSHSRGAGRGAARLLGAGDTVPECTFRPAATTGGVPVNCAAQPSIPYDSKTRSHTESPTFETAELHAEIGLICIWFDFGAGTWQKLVLAGCLNRPQCITKKLVLAGGLNRQS